MRLHAYPVSATTLPFPPRRLSNRARRLPWVIGRATGTGRVEIGAGAGLVAGAGQAQRSVDCLLLPLSDDELRTLARIDDAEGGLIADVNGMQILVRHGLKVAQAGRALGIASRADAQKLSRLVELHPRVLAACQERKLTANHARWLLGVEPAEALARVMGLTDLPTDRPKRRAVPTVADLRQLTVQDRKHSAAQVATSDPYGALAQEAHRISELLAAPVELTWGPDGGELRIGFTDVEAILGVLERMGRFSLPSPGPGTSMRFIRLPLASLDELAYLVGTADG